MSEGYGDEAIAKDLLNVGLLTAGGSAAPALIAAWAGRT